MLASAACLCFAASATHCNTLQHTLQHMLASAACLCFAASATHCNTLQHTLQHMLASAACLCFAASLATHRPSGRVDTCTVVVLHKIPIVSKEKKARHIKKKKHLLNTSAPTAWLCFVAYWSKETPPPGGVFYLLCSLDEEPCVRDFTFLDGYCSTVQGLLDWFEVDLGFTELLSIQIDLCVLCVFVLYFPVSLSSCPFFGHPALPPPRGGSASRGTP